MGLEFELKYAATPAQQAAIHDYYPGQWRTVAMQTTYYDTPNFALSSRHITLRLRLENGASICTVKAPAEGDVRGEWECSCKSVTDAVPILCKLGCPQELAELTAPGLIPICGARFVRQALTLTLADCTIELALDEGWLLGNGREAPLCEVEVECKSGNQEGVVVFAQSLSEKNGLTLQKKSKFRRALALAEGEQYG